MSTFIPSLDTPLRCTLIRHAYRRRDDDPLVFDCARCDETWNAREKMKNPPNHRPRKGVFREGGPPYCEACGNSLDLTGDNPHRIRLTDISRFQRYDQTPERNHVFLCVGCRHSLLALGSETDIKSTLHGIDSGRRPIDLKYGHRAEYGRFAKD